MTAESTTPACSAIRRPGDYWVEIGSAAEWAGAILTALAFGAAIWAIRLQAKDLELQREELRLQRQELEGQRDELAKSAQVQARLAELELIRVVESESEALRLLLTGFEVAPWERSTGGQRLLIHNPTPFEVRNLRIYLFTPEEIDPDVLGRPSSAPYVRAFFYPFCVDEDFAGNADANTDCAITIEDIKRHHEATEATREVTDHWGVDLSRGEGYCYTFDAVGHSWLRVDSSEQGQVLGLGSTHPTEVRSRLAEADGRLRGFFTAR